MGISANVSNIDSIDLACRPPSPGVHVLGIRHHGPGSARSLVAALRAIEPSIVLIEGPPEANDLIRLVGADGMVPPVAILVYRPDQPRDAVYYPFAEFSPEWQAIRHALDHGIPARFIDLPASYHLAKNDAEAEARPTLDFGPEPDPPRRPVDPLGLLAAAAGFDDSERWWDFIVESRRHGADSANGDGVGMFAAILAAMAEVRATVPEVTDRREVRREAHMRQAIRAVQKEGHQQIAVVCGAWHAPVLDPSTWPPARLDAAYLKALPRVKVAATWVPWTYGRLTRASGYGAGIVAPGWYDHLWNHHAGVVERWLTRVARLLRDERLDASSASVIEAVRLADALATLRGRPLADLADLDEATQSVLCGGQAEPIRLIARKLTVGERLGRVPDETPAVPLQADLARLQKRLRLPASATATTKIFDLRNPTDQERSQLLHRLNLLGIGWGRVVPASGQGTFKEGWTLEWTPDLAIGLIEASVWGTSVADAAAASTTDQGRQAAKLADLTALLNRAILADLPASVAAIMTRIETAAAGVADVAELMVALPPLANLTRYGSVRPTDVVAVAHAASGMIARISVGLPLACHSLDDPAAAELFAAILGAEAAVGIMNNPTDRAAWHEALTRLAGAERVHGLIAGRASRILADNGIADAAETARRMNLAVSPAADPGQAASWVEGFLKGGGDVLLHDEALFGIFDGWLASLPEASFPTILPLLRRTFATFESPLRRNLGELARDRSVDTAGSDLVLDLDPGIDPERAAAAVPIVALLLGLNLPDPGDSER